MRSEVGESRNFQETAKSLCVWSSMNSTGVVGTEVTGEAGRGSSSPHLLMQGLQPFPPEGASGGVFMPQALGEGCRHVGTLVSNPRHAPPRSHLEEHHHCFAAGAPHGSARAGALKSMFPGPGEEQVLGRHSKEAVSHCL